MRPGGNEVTRRHRPPVRLVQIVIGLRFVLFLLDAKKRTPRVGHPQYQPPSSRLDGSPNGRPPWQLHLDVTAVVGFSG
jgi:hypothetical protein